MLVMVTRTCRTKVSVPVKYISVTFKGKIFLKR